MFWALYFKYIFGMMYLLIYILGVIGTFVLLVLDDAHGIFSKTYDAAWNVDSTIADPNDPSRGWVCTWVSILWPITMTVTVGVMLVSWIKLHIFKTNPLNMLYDRVSKALSPKNDT